MSYFEEVNKLVKPKKKPVKTGNSLANRIMENSKKFENKRKPTIMEKRLASIYEKTTTSDATIYPRRNENYQISFQKLSVRFPDLAQKAGGIDVCKAIYVNDATKEVTVQWPNLHVELLKFNDLITIV